MKRQVLKFDDIKGMLNEDEMKGIVGGCVFWNGSSWVGGWGGGALSNVIPVLGGDIGGNPSSPDHILNGSDNTPGQSNSLAAFVAWAMTLQEGSYTNTGSGSFSYSSIPQTGNPNFQIDSGGAYLFDGTVYIGASGIEYNKISVDGGVNWIPVAIGGATVQMPGYSVTRDLTGFTETYAFNNQQAISFLNERNSSNPKAETVLALLGFGLGYVVDPMAGVGIGIQSVLHTGNSWEWQNIQNAYNNGSGLIINARYSTPLMDGAPTRVFYTIKDGFGNILGTLIAN